MVSLRRRRLLGLCCGPNGYVTPLPFLTAEEMISGISNNNAVAVNGRPIPVNLVKQQEEEKTPPKDGSSAPNGKPPSEFGSGSPSDFGSLSPRDPQNQSVSDQPIKRRKRHRRKQVENQEPCLMRGVYFKNMKWQAAIKVDKKQIHLGTVSSQEEAARLYDRAAFMCGREPNFELSEDDKQELRKFSWDDFLTLTRRAITNKKYKRRIGLGAVKSSKSQVPNSLQDRKHSVDDISGSEEPRQDSSSS